MLSNHSLSHYSSSCYSIVCVFTPFPFDDVLCCFFSLSMFRSSSPWVSFIPSRFISFSPYFYCCVFLFGFGTSKKKNKPTDVERNSLFQESRQREKSKKTESLLFFFSPKKHKSRFSSDRIAIFWIVELAIELNHFEPSHRLFDEVKWNVRISLWKIFYGSVDFNFARKKNIEL